MYCTELLFPSQLMNPVGTKLKRRMFFISVFGVTAPDEYVILKVTQDTSVYDAIAQVLETVAVSFLTKVVIFCTTKFAIDFIY